MKLLETNQREDFKRFGMSGRYLVDFVKAISIHQSGNY